MLIEPVTKFDQRYYYEAEYAAARRVFEREENYDGWYHAMNNLWDTYCFVERARLNVADGGESPCFYAQACALWSLYVLKCLNVFDYSEPGDIPF